MVTKYYWNTEDVFKYSEYFKEIEELEMKLIKAKSWVKIAEDWLNSGSKLTPDQHKRYASIRTKNLHNIKKCEYGIQRRKDDMKRIEQKYQ